MLRQSATLSGGFSRSTAVEFSRPRAEHFVLKLVWRLKGALGHFWRQSLLFWRITVCIRALTQLFGRNVLQEHSKKSVEKLNKEFVLEQNRSWAPEFFLCVQVSHDVKLASFVSTLAYRLEYYQTSIIEICFLQDLLITTRTHTRY